MKIKTSELRGIALDWAVAKCEGYIWDDYYHPQYSADWAHGGPIIDICGINLETRTSYWVALLPHYRGDGYTPLIAAMRCYVASKMGEEVEIPNELINKE